MPEGRADGLHVEWVDAATDLHASRDAESRRRRDRSRQRGQLVAALVVLALALTAAGLWRLTHRGPKPPLAITFDGRPVVNADSELSRAEAGFIAYVHAHHGVTSTNTRCYFERTGGRLATDVSDHLFCGPLLFHGGSTARPYLMYRLATSNADVGAVTGGLKVTAAGAPDLLPTAPPAQARLERPDRRTPPRGADGLVPPPPAPAPPDLLKLMTSAEFATLPAAPARSVVGTRDLGVELQASGQISSFGHGMDALAAPPGQKLWVAKLHFIGGSVLGTDAPPEIGSFGLSVDAGAPHPLRLDLPTDSNGNIDTTQFLVAAVPVGTKALDLVVADAGLTQRMSLLTGKPAPGNIAIYQRPYENRLAGVSPPVTIAATIGGVAATQQTSVTLELDGGSLDYYLPFGTAHASGVNRALLTVSVCLRSPDVIGQDNGAGNCRPYESASFSVTPTGGTAIPARVYPDGSVAVDVPADFTTGVITLNGPQDLGSGTYLRFDRPCMLTIAFRP